jgi:acyl-CoA synthetase (AMP-forming)/AMP-acid ligase II
MGEYVRIESAPGPLTVAEAIVRQVQCRPDAVAIMAPNRPDLTYRALWRQVTESVLSLNAAGIGRDGRVAVVLPNGPEMAVAILSAMACAACAPLNASASVDEYRLLLGNLRADGLIVPEGEDSPAIMAARGLGLQVIRLSFTPQGPTGTFELVPESARPAAPAERPSAETLALLMYTSGTTSKAKIVPLTHRDLVGPAAMRVSVMRLTSADRCLALTPLSTSTGIRQSLVATVISGGSVVCTPGFHAGSFVSWLDEFRPTYYSASPTVHMLVLEELKHRKPARPISLKFIRSSSARLPAGLESQLEAALGVPVLEGYGMTETGVIAQNPPPPGRRRLGSVGITCGVEIGIMDESGNRLPIGAAGEVAVRGAGVTSGYENDPEANRKAFHDGWFKTGDQGYLDEDGYLFLTGRLKEIINRGGNKVSSAEVDEALMSHPQVLEAVSFPVPHARLGEDVAAAVVLRRAGSVTAQQLRDFAFDRLAAFKVPSQFVIVPQLPKNALGKVNRSELASALDHALRAEFTPPRDALEELVARVFMETLGAECVGAFDNFFALGGDSLRGSQVVVRLNSTLGLNIPVSSLFSRPTVAEFAVELSAVTRAGAPPESPQLVSLPRERYRTVNQPVPLGGGAVPEE